VVNAQEGYVYVISRVYRNHASVHEQIYIYRREISTGTETFIYYDANVASTGLQVVKYSLAGRPEIFYVTIDFDKITDGAHVGGSSVRMLIDPGCYVYTTLTSAIEADILNLERNIPSNPFLITPQPAAGAAEITNGLAVPAGQTGFDSYIDVFINFPGDQFFTDFEGKLVKGIWKFIINNTEIVDFAGYLTDGGVSPSVPLTITVDGTNKIVTAECEFTISDSYTSGARIYIQLKEASAIGSDFTIEFLDMQFDPQESAQMMIAKGEENYKTERQIKKELANYISGSVNIITFKSTGTSGIDADFCGLNAIGDALASITNAAENHRYELRGSGEFLFDHPDDFEYQDSFGEYTVIVGKDYVDIKGESRERLIIAAELPDNLAIDYGEYQPVMWNSKSKLINATIIAKNCRYGLHFEGGDLVTDNTEFLENCIIWHKGNYNYAAESQGGSTAWTATNAIGAGIRDGQTWNISKCILRSDQALPIQCHSAIGAVDNGAWINTYDCQFIGPASIISFNPFPNNRIVKINLYNPTISSKPIFHVGSIYHSFVATADHCGIELTADILPIAFANNEIKGAGLRIVSKSTGVDSIVIIDHTSSAFNSIVGVAADTILKKTRWGNDYQYGYEWRNGGVGMSGYAIGHIDVDENNTARTNGLGALLGDCSSVNKVLSVNIDGTDYDITFSQNHTAQTNAQVIAIIDAVISAVADVDVYAVGQEYYPDFRGNEIRLNTDSTAIKAGMGVIRYGVRGVKVAANGDNHIDGIALDDFAVGQEGRIITGGYIYAFAESKRFKILEVSSATRNVGDELGISEAQAGYFDISASPKLLRAVEENILEI